jgi:AraC-like DNA-binding protein
MILQVYPSPLELLPFVSGYLYGYNDFSDSQLVIPTIPRGVPALMVIMNEENGGQIEITQPKQINPLIHGVFLFGQATQVWWLKASIRHAYMIVLKPTALQTLFGESAAIFTDTVIQLDDMFPEYRFLAEQLTAEKSKIGQLSILDTFLKQLFQNKNINHNEVDGAVQCILQTQGRVKVSELSIRERIGVRTLTRKFYEQVGMSPKQYASIIRFRSIMNYLFIFPNASWLDTTYRFGYYDQSHFIKDFQHFTGQSPTQYLALDQNLDGQFIKALSKF